MHIIAAKLLEGDRISCGRVVFVQVSGSTTHIWYTCQGARKQLSVPSNQKVRLAA